jgi:hypothetical protein
MLRQPVPNRGGCHVRDGQDPLCGCWRFAAVRVEAFRVISGSLRRYLPDSRWAVAS